MNRLRNTMFVVAVFLALLLSAMNAVPALADGSTPPAEETPSAEAPPAEELTGEAEPAAAGDEALPPAEGVDPVSEEQAPLVESVLEGLPEDTQLIVMDEDGEALPLASQEAAETLAGGDPRWCPVGVTPGAASCSPSFTYFNGGGGLIEWLQANPKNVAGVIWIESSYSNAEGNVPIELSGFGSTVNYALTLNGGWSGNNNTLLNPNAPSTFVVPLLINWNAPVTIKNIVIEGASGGGVALEVTTPGNITLTNVDVQNNTTDWGGAYLNNSSGAGNVIVNDSTFNGNTGGNALGLEISSKGIVTLKNVSAIGNTYEGAYIYNSDAPTAKAVTLNGFNNFSLNGANGLTIYSRGAVTLSNITAIYNSGGSGTFVDNRFGVANVIVKGVNTFSNNGWDGLRVFSLGAITLSNITANDNGTDPDRPAATDFGGGDYDYNAFGKGAFLYNWSTAPKPVTLTGVNTFNGNASTGLYIDANGLVRVSSLTANDNGCDPLKDLDDYPCAGAYIVGGGVTLTGYGMFVGNAAQGLEIYNAWVPSLGTSVGAIMLTNLYAEGNGEGGVWAVNGGLKPYNVTISGTNYFVDNQGDGLFVWSNGVVILSNVTANGNDESGVYVNNTDASSPKAVMIKGRNIFNDNGGDGLAVYSFGAITTYNVTAMYNSDTGVALDNCGWDGLNDCQAYFPQPVTMNGINNTSENGGDGLYIVSRGAIKVSSLTANYNGNLGVFLDNLYDNALGGITQTGYATFLGNFGLSGFNAFSTGAVAMINITASGNNTFGGVIWNDFNPAKPANVLISGTNVFNDNGKSGLWIDTFGAVTLNNITANDNGWGFIGENYHGVEVDNASGALLSRPVTVNGINTFNGNNGSGLSVDSLGAIKVSKVTASSNQWSGAFLFNRHGVLNAPITLVGYGVFNDNIDGGLFAVSNGAILTSNITANNNTNGHGVYFDHYSITATPVTVTMLGVNTFNNNFIHGLSVLSDGQITLNNITANGNGSWGAYLSNEFYGSVARNIILNGTNNFIGNTDGGLFFFATGSAFLTRVTAALNDDGVFGGNASNGIEGYAFGNITLTCGSLFFNEGYGYYLNAIGVVSLKGVYSYANGDADSANGSSVLITRTCPLP
jgi:putative surface-exposed virulence protein